MSIRLTNLDYKKDKDVIEEDIGLAFHDKGYKDDAIKPSMNLVLAGFARALMEVGKVGTFGAEKYTRNGWKSVEDAKERYSSALLRHYFTEETGEVFDPDSHLYHAAHLAWNALARLEFILKENENNET